ncbi:hypothetical protein FACS189468_5690 [Spirochaetia bacterium]|nr:hypothetical protein FACS189468_5690 [Spirochaetia bacterium]
MKKKMVIAVLMGCMGCALAMAGGTKQSADAGKPEKVEGSVSAGISAIRVAYDLAKYGYGSYSASALIEAADILAKTQTQPLEAAAEKDTAADAGAAETAHPEFTPANLIADAKKFAAGDATMLAWAAKVESSLGSATRGAVGGPREGVEAVAALSTMTYKLPFRAGQPATVFVSGDGSTDLDLYVYDENGNLIAYDEDYSDDCLVRWNPRWTGSFIIVVKNLGRVWNRYTLVTD